MNFSKNILRKTIRSWEFDSIKGYVLFIISTAHKLIITKSYTFPRSARYSPPCWWSCRKLKQIPRENGSSTHGRLNPRVRHISSPKHPNPRLKGWRKHWASCKVRLSHHHSIPILAHRAHGCILPSVEVCGGLRQFSQEYWSCGCPKIS